LGEATLVGQVASADRVALGEATLVGQVASADPVALGDPASTSATDPKSAITA
jgi:hypothetical protein